MMADFSKEDALSLRPGSACALTETYTYIFLSSEEAKLCCLQVWLASRQTPAENKQAIVDFCILRRDFAQLLGRALSAGSTPNRNQADLLAYLQWLAALSS